MKPEEGREGNEYSNRKSKRRSLRWIIQHEQTAKGGTKHFVRQAFLPVIIWFPRTDRQECLSYSLKAIQGLRFVVEGVEHGQELGDDQQVLNLLREIQQFELAAIAAKGRVVRYQFADPTRVDILHATEIKKNLLLASIDQAANGITESDGAFTHSHRPTQVEDRYIPCLTLIKIEFCHLLSPLEMSSKLKKFVASLVSKLLPRRQTKVGRDRRGAALFEAGEGLFFTIIHVKNGQQFCDRQKVLQFLREIEKLQLAPLFIDRGIAGNQFSNAA